MDCEEVFMLNYNRISSAQLTHLFPLLESPKIEPFGLTKTTAILIPCIVIIMFFKIVWELKQY